MDAHGSKPPPPPDVVCKLVLSRVAAFDVPYPEAEDSSFYLKFQLERDDHVSDGYLPTAVRTGTFTGKPSPAIFKETELVLPLATQWRGGRIRVTAWDAAVDATVEAEALGCIVVDIARAAQALPVVKLVILKGGRRRTGDGSRYPAFRVGFTHQIVPLAGGGGTGDDHPLARCLACLGGTSPGATTAAAERAAKEEEAARVLQCAQKKRVQAEEDRREHDAAPHEAQAGGAGADGGGPSSATKGKPAGGSGAGGLASLFTLRSKTRPPREAEKEHPGRQRGAGASPARS